ncbi:hypothetical protein CJU90_5662 [Yarrowia sp. C11]|nr:hypothetical protein CJU90_5662 [Yarrowia sp. C11]KAG5364247.1 hypothetical protein CKK34_3040 [Yarrowia sp. E02]
MSGPRRWTANFIPEIEPEDDGSLDMPIIISDDEHIVKEEDPINMGMLYGKNSIHTNVALMTPTNQVTPTLAVDQGVDQGADIPDYSSFQGFPSFPHFDYFQTSAPVALNSINYWNSPTSTDGLPVSFERSNSSQAIAPPSTPVRVSVPKAERQPLEQLQAPMVSPDSSLSTQIDSPSKSVITSDTQSTRDKSISTNDTDANDTDANDTDANDTDTKDTDTNDTDTNDTATNGTATLLPDPLVARDLPQFTRFPGFGLLEKVVVKIVRQFLSHLQLNKELVSLVTTASLEKLDQLFPKYRRSRNMRSPPSDPWILKTLKLCQSVVKDQPSGENEDGKNLNIIVRTCLNDLTWNEFADGGFDYLTLRKTPSTKHHLEEEDKVDDPPPKRRLLEEALRHFKPVEEVQTEELASSSTAIDTDIFDPDTTITNMDASMLPKSDEYTEVENVSADSSMDIKRVLDYFSQAVEDCIDTEDPEDPEDPEDDFIDTSYDSYYSTADCDTSIVKEQTSDSLVPGTCDITHSVDFIDTSHDSFYSTADCDTSIDVEKEQTSDFFVPGITYSATESSADTVLNVSGASNATIPVTIAPIDLSTVISNKRDTRSITQEPLINTTTSAIVQITDLLQTPLPQAETENLDFWLCLLPILAVTYSAMFY